jgi:acyl-CoA reductase-like NAD-dependent aldehyde dehydrogenase
MEDDKENLAALLTREEGKTIAESRGEVQRSINVADFCAGEARRLNGETIQSELPLNFAYTVKQPIGVVACITPWNFPVAIPVWKIAPALVAGNTVVFKPATLTPATAVRIVEIFEEAGLPEMRLSIIRRSAPSHLPGRTRSAFGYTSKLRGEAQRSNAKWAARIRS